MNNSLEKYPPEESAEQLPPEEMGKPAIESPAEELPPRLFADIDRALNGESLHLLPLTNAEAKMLIDRGMADEVTSNIDKFVGLDNSTAEKLIERGKLSLAIWYASYFGPDIRQVLLAHTDTISSSEKLINELIADFPGDLLLDKDLAYAILRACSASYVTAQRVSRLDLEAMLGPEKATDLRAHIAAIEPDLSQVADRNPYEDEASSAELHRQSNAINRELRSPASAEWEQVASRVAASYSDLQGTITDKYGEEYAMQLFGGATDKSGDAWPVYRRLVADYLAAKDVDANELSSALENAHKAFDQALSFDTKYYDKLFTEWDANRIGQRKFQEVFLGRDGVYAYVARLAQIEARRRLERAATGDIGQQALDFPSYIVYPSQFEDLSDDAKYMYLCQTIPDPEAVSMFDTGFHGTVPLGIQKIFGISGHDRERIRMIIAHNRDYQVLGIREGAAEHHEVVYPIEHNAKDEESAEGLYRTSDGRIEHYAKPTPPEERLAFGMTQLALHRHYYTKELQAGLADTQFISEALPYEREMRIDNARSDAEQQGLRELFSAGDIDAELLRVGSPFEVVDSKDYEDIGLIPRKRVAFDIEVAGTEFTVKDISPDERVAGGPVDEFETLLLMKKFSLGAPQPVARVFTKDQGGFMVTEKVKGQNAGDLEEHLAEQGVQVQDRKRLLGDVEREMWKIKEAIRNIGLKKRWRLENFIVALETVDGQLCVKTVRPTNFEHMRVANP